MNGDKINRRNHWAAELSVYHIFVPSFKDSNGDGIGDLGGIIEKIDYLNDGTERSLGARAIWLSPIFESPMADFGYDVSDYYKINPIFGTLETFGRLLKEARKRGVKILLDLVPNHTSSAHPWFLESRSSKDHPKRDWYVWQDPGPDGHEPNNWISVFGGSSWELDEKTGQYYLHTFLPQQPDLNWRNPEVREEMEKIMRYWLSIGVDGFRVDAASHLFEDENLKNDPANPNYNPGRNDPYDALLHVNSKKWRPEIFNVMDRMCEIAGEYNQKIIISEAYMDLPQMIEMYGSCRNKLHIPFNFNLISLPWDALSFKKFVDSFEASLGNGDFPNYVFGNHDHSRVATRLGHNRARLAAMLLLTLRGIPFIYYGDELGMEDAEVPQDKIKDRIEVKLPGFKLGRDPERTPMQWDDGPRAGFSSAEPWLPLGKNYKTANAKSESDDSKSILNLYRKLMCLKNNSPAVSKGVYSPMESKSPNVFSFIRKSEEEKVCVILNFSSVTVEESCGFGSGDIICSTHMDIEGSKPVDLMSINLRPYEGVVIKLN